MGLFDKKYCDICGEKIGLLGNKKLENANMCKNCAAKLSPWFTGRRHTTLDDIKEQLDYREKNKEAVNKFNVTRILGKTKKVYIDEDARKFFVASTSNYKDENPDVLDFSQVVGCDIDIDEHKNEIMKKDKEGKSVSFNPPKYEYKYDFDVIIRVNHPYFNEMKIRVNPSSVVLDRQVGSSGGVTPVPGRILKPGMLKNAALNGEYQTYLTISYDIKDALTHARQTVRDEIDAAKAPKKAVACPWCGATTIPDKNGCCEYCGGAVDQK